ncbi:MAG: LysR family transcriptional regulator [Oceanospirillaceae bacterium]|nr:LysR family transcriptional regulator [Oceanospirillaceae bacterium]HCI01811.1 LysR family transcriptional regulator [Oceanospirillaceae bacterium]
MTTSLRQLEALKAVASMGSYTRAAAALNISQPAVSRLINSFSESIGFELFHRQNGKLVPTQETRYLLEEANRLLDGVANFENLAKDMHLRQSGHLGIACLPGFATTKLPGILANFLKTRPNVILSVEPDRPEYILEWMINKQYDIGITQAFQGHPAVIHQNLNMRTVCILPPGHRLTALSEISPEDLDGERLIHPKSDSTFTRDLLTEFTACGVQMKSLAVIRQFGSACLMVAAGAGVSIVNEIDAYEYEDKGLVIRPFTPNMLYRMAVLYPRHSPRSILAMEFMETFLESMQPYLVEDPSTE